MKSVNLLFFMLLYSLSYAQPFDYDTANYKLVNLHYENSGGEKGLTNYINNPKGIIYKAVWQQLNKDRFSENFFIYRHDKLLNLYRTFSDSLTSNKTFEYNEKGLLLKETFSRSDGKSGYAEYIYDDSGKQTKLICKGLNAWFHGDILYEYDDKSKKKSAKIFRDDKEIGTISFEYSVEGNLLKAYWDFPNLWNQTFLYEYVSKNKTAWANTNPLLQIPKGYRIKEEAYTYNNKVGGPSYFTYGKEGKLTEKIFVRSDTFKTITNFTYNTFNQLIQSQRNYADGKQAVFKFKYNEDGQITEKSYVRSDGIIGKESFLYDINGRLIAARYDHMDSWLTGNLIFRHDKFDRIIGAEFLSDSGFKANLAFEINEEGLTQKIHWVFSFGDFQTYTFSYEFVP